MTDSGHSGLLVRDMSAGYRAAAVLRDISLPCLHQGRVMALVGPNGAGKSTLLKSLAGLLPARGQVLLHGRDVSAMALRARAALFGYMPQALPEDLEASALESLISILRACGHTGPDEEVLAQAGMWLRRLDIGAIALRPMRGLSGGQRQMVSLAQALVREPEVLLLDEPTSALDLRYQVLVMEAVRAYARSGRMAIVVLHDLQLAARWADDIVVLRGGTVHGAGAPGDVLTPRMLANVYGVRARVERCSQGALQVVVDGAEPT